MRNRIFLRLNFLALCCVLSPAVTAGEPESAELSSSMDLGVPAKPVVRNAPKYPGSELRRGRQGWVQLSYVVAKDGSILDPVVTKSSGSTAFEKAALRTVENFEYEPATWNGEPVQQCHTDVMISFALEGEETVVSRRFRNRYRKIDRALNEGDIEEAQKLVTEIRDSWDMTLSEMAWLWTARARLAGTVGDKDAQLTALRMAIGNNGTWVEEKVYPKLLLVKTVLELEQGKLSEALASHDKLVTIYDDSATLDKLAPTVESVRQMVAGDSVLSVPAEIGSEDDCEDCATNWHYSPLRRKFSIADVKGTLRDIEFRCPWQRVVDKAATGLTWELPEEWGKCSIIVFGEPGTTFQLLEIPVA